MKHNLIFGAICIVISAVLGCTTGQHSVDISPIRIGVILPLSGDSADWGNNAKAGVDMAIADINREGGINGTGVKPVFEDGKCDPKEAVSAASKLIYVDKVSVIVGEICSGATLAIGKLAQENGVVLINPCSGSPSISDAGDFIFRTWIPNDAQARALARYALSHGLYKAAILQIDNDYGKTLTNGFTTEYRRLNGTIEVVETYSGDSGDMRTHLTKIKTIDTDTLVIFSYASDGLRIIQQMDELGINLPILAANGVNDPKNFALKLGTRANGIIMSEIKDSTDKEFIRRFEDSSGQKWSVGICTDAAYDSTMLAVKAIREAGEDPKRIKESLAMTKDYPGVSGNITFDSKGDLMGEYGIYTFKGGELMSISD